MGPGGSHPPRLHAGTLRPAWINIFITNTVTCHGPSDQFCKRISHGIVTRQQPGNTKVFRGTQTGAELTQSLKSNLRISAEQMPAPANPREAKLGNASWLLRNLSRCQDISAKDARLSGPSASLLGKYFLFRKKRCFFPVFLFRLKRSGPACGAEPNAIHTKRLDFFQNTCWSPGRLNCPVTCGSRGDPEGQAAGRRPRSCPWVLGCPRMFTAPPSGPGWEERGGRAGTGGMNGDHLAGAGKLTGS